MVRILRMASALAALALLSTAARADEKKDEKKEDPYAALIGKPAPEITGEFSLNGKAVKLADLKGKVVLVDFWAVWCGPCIATFPHLIEWNKDFKAKGLEIVGVTSYYETVGFDKEAGKTKRLKPEDKMTKDQEHVMLKDFAEHHKLEHRLMTLGKDDIKKVYEEYKVRGIPQVVLIDRKGIVRMVKVGSGEANAKALAEMIEKLIAEK